MSTEVTVAFITGICAIIVALVTWMQNNKTNLSEAYRQLSEAQLNMQREIDRQDEKLAEFVSERDRLRYQDDLKTSYIRGIGWANSAMFSTRSFWNGIRSHGFLTSFEVQ